MRTETFFLRHPVFSFAQAVTILAPGRSRRAMVDRLKHHVRNGVLKQVTRGVYAVVPPGESPKRFRPDPFLVGVAIRPDALYSYHSALELLGASHSTWNHVTLFSGRRRREISADGIRYSVFQNPGQMATAHGTALGRRQVERRGKLLAVTGAERTLVEGFRRLALVGGVEELVTSAAGFPALDVKLLLVILEQYRTSRLWGAVGWFLERFRAQFHVTDDLLGKCERQRPAAPQYLERESRGGILVKRWNLIIPNSLSTALEPDESKS